MANKNDIAPFERREARRWTRASDYVVNVDAHVLNAALPNPALRKLDESRKRSRRGLWLPTIAVASIWLDGPLALGLEPMQMVLLLVSVVVAVLTVVPGRAKPLNGGVHLVLLAAFVFLSIKP